MKNKKSEKGNSLKKLRNISKNISVNMTAFSGAGTVQELMYAL